MYRLDAIKTESHMSQVIDKSKTYRTRNGQEVRIYATDGFGKKPIHGAVFDSGWVDFAWTSAGFIWPSDAADHHPYDLIEVVPIIERWAVIQKSDRRCIGTYKCLPEANIVLGNLNEEYKIVLLREVVE